MEKRRICDRCSWMSFSGGDTEEAWLKYGRRGRCLKCQRGIISRWRKEDPKQYKAYLLRYRLKRKKSKL